MMKLQPKQKPAHQALSAKESGRLETCEQVIERGKDTFIEVGLALDTICEERLYRATHTTFDAYCRERWGFTRIHAYRLREAAGVAGMLPNGNKVTNEAQARALHDVPAEDRAAVLKEASKHGNSTARSIREAARRRAERDGVEGEDVQPRVLNDIPLPDSDDELGAFLDKLARSKRHPTSQDKPKLLRWIEDNVIELEPPEEDDTSLGD